ncbi:MAG: DUF1684 domain-containing protein [Arcicella sp.]|nr:DUF1684 domain-containing protein [Arcicella sp.]
MFKNKFLLLSLFASLMAIMVYSLVSNEDPKSAIPAVDDAYLTTLQNIRKDKDTYLKTDKESPIENKPNFKGLKYFEVNPDFKVLAKLDILTTGQKINIAMTGGETEEYEAFANATFELEGQKCALKIFKAEDGSLFLPFKDLTSNKETYGSGRYLDLDMRMIKNQQIQIDFNRCYHPYCTYNRAFTCPVPPAENLVNVAVKAGERL